jgi:GNAT superfamily N-acetyltransferase
VPDAYLTALSYDQHVQQWESSLETVRSSEVILVAEDPGYSIVGFASGGHERSGDSAYSGELYTIYLLASYQGRGVGRWLTVEVARRLLQMGHTSMVVWVLAANPACAFYAALGGQRLQEKTITIGGRELAEVAYGWRDLRSLAAA